MAFASPVPWEADAFYAQPGMNANGLSMDKWPVGTGPYMMTEYVQDRRHVMKRNPNFRGEPYPCEGEPGDKERRPARRLRQDHALHRHASSPRSIRRRCRARRSSSRATWTCPRSSVRSGAWSSASTWKTPTGQAPVRGSGLPVPADHRHQQLVPGLQHGSTRWWARATRPSSRSRTASCARRSRSRSTGRRATAASSRTKGGMAAHGPVPPGVFGSREGTPKASTTR